MNKQTRAFAVNAALAAMREKRDAQERLASLAPEMLESLQWALGRIAEMAPHRAEEGDGELYAYAKAMAVVNRARALPQGASA